MNALCSLVMSPRLSGSVPERELGEEQVGIRRPQMGAARAQQGGAGFISSRLRHSLVVQIEVRDVGAARELLWDGATKLL